LATAPIKKSDKKIILFFIYKYLIEITLLRNYF